MDTRNTTTWSRGAVAGALALLLVATWGCRLDRTGDPNLQGPSDAGVSVDLTAAPDTVNADGVSTSLVTLTLRDNLGEPLVNRPILFQHDGDGRMVPAPGARYVGPVQTGQVMATDGSGRTSVVYRAGRSIRFVEVWVRPYATDTEFTAFYRYVQIVQQ